MLIFLVGGHKQGDAKQAEHLLNTWPDVSLLQIVAVPPSLAMTSLHVSHQMSYSISQASAVPMQAKLLGVM